MNVYRSHAAEMFIVCSKKTAKSAVRRNRLKRILRECVRLEKMTTPWFFRIVKNPTVPEGVALRKDFQECLQWIHNV